MDFYELDGSKDLARDPETNAIINVNGLDYSQYLSAKSVKNEKNQKVHTIDINHPTFRVRATDG